jgi:DNA-binding NtrC family response regulator
MLDASHRLHSVVEETALLAAANNAFSLILGSSPTAIHIAHGGVTRRTAQEPRGDSVTAAMDKSAQEGLVVLDPQPPGGIAFPIHAGARKAGAVYVVHSGLAAVKGPRFELLKLIAEDVGLASMNLDSRSPQASPAAANQVAAGVSLRDAKLEFERRLLALRLDEAKGNVAAAARSLDMDRGQLSRLMKKHHLDRATFRPLHPGGI